MNPVVPFAPSPQPSPRRGEGAGRVRDESVASTSAPANSILATPSPADMLHAASTRAREESDGPSAPHRGLREGPGEGRGVLRAGFRSQTDRARGPRHRL